MIVLSDSKVYWLFSLKINKQAFQGDRIIYGYIYSGSLFAEDSDSQQYKILRTNDKINFSVMTLYISQTCN